MRSPKRSKARFDGHPLKLTEEEWQKRLTPEQYQVLRQGGTECAFQNSYFDRKEEGTYLCAACELPLFLSERKFDSKTGWPSFWEPIYPENVSFKEDHSHGMIRIEVECSRCKSHLGHIFKDGPPPTGDRICINSAALKLILKE